MEHEAKSLRCVPGYAGKTYYVFATIVSLYCSVYLEFAIELSKSGQIEGYVGLITGALTLAAAARVFAMFAFLLLAVLFLLRYRGCARWIVRHRYMLAIALLAVLVLLEIHGSSINVWGAYLGESESEGLLFGIPRTVRSDEWLVFTPFSFSQEFSGYSAISNIIRGCPTDVTMVYGQPAWSLATLFRPFLWGYMVLGSAKGLSFFWCGRALFLILSSYECAMLLTDGNKKASAYAAILVGFAPIIEWWFAINGIAEIFIFGQGLVCALHRLLHTTKVKVRMGWACAIAWFIGCYALVLYPAWQICFLYVFGCMGVAVFVRWLAKEERGGRLKQVLCVAPYLLFALVLAVGLLAVVFYQSWDAIQSVLNTAYPGKRVDTGGELFTPLLNFVFAPLSAVILPDSYPQNVCAGARFVSLFPLGLVFACVLVVRGIRDKEPDVFLVALLIPYVLFLAFGLVGFLPALAKITLLSMTYSQRITLATGYLDVVLLARSLVVLNNTRKPTGGLSRSIASASAPRLCLVAIVSLALVVLARWMAPEYMGRDAVVLLFMAWYVLFLPVLMPSSFFERSGVSRWGWMLTSSVLVFVFGFCVNPVQRGIEVISQSPTISELKSIARDELDALWLADTTIEGQALIMAGARSIASVNVYPNLQRWYAIDPGHKNEDAYNRYAHMFVEMGESTSFNNKQDDVLSIVLAPQDVQKLGASYWLSRNQLEEYNSEYVQFVLEKPVGDLKVYRIVYPQTLEQPAE